MRSTLLGIFVLSSAWLVACGGSVGDDTGTAGGGGSAGSGGSGGSGGSDPGDVLSGSYDVVFKEVKANLQGPPIPYANPPSEGHAARIDLAKNETGDGYVAVFTSRWGEPAAYTVTVAADAVTLAGQGTVRDHDGGTDTWESIVLARGADGRLSGTMEATGHEDVFQGDVGWMGDATSGGTVASDTTMPELSSAPTSAHGPTDALLPWDSFDVTIAEGVDEAKLTSSLYVSPALTGGGNGGAAQSVSWQLSPTAAETSWAGVVRATGRFDGWDGLGQQALLAAPGGIPDLAGNVSVSLSATFDLLDVGLPVAAMTMDDDSSPLPGAWGAVGFFGQLAGSDPVCETGGCAVIGPFDNGYCTQDHAGLAMRFSMASQPHAVNVRFRAFAGPSWSGSDAPPPNDASFAPFWTEIVQPGGAPVPGDAVTVATWHDLGAQAELRWASDWQTAKVPIGSQFDGPEIGFALYAASQGAMYGCYGAVPPPTKMKVIVESITLE